MLKLSLNAAICAALLLTLVTASTAGDLDDKLLPPIVHKPVFDDRLQMHLQEVVFDVRDAKGQKLDPNFVFGRFRNDSCFVVRHLGDAQMLHEIRYLPKESQFVCGFNMEYHFYSDDRLLPGSYTFHLNLTCYGQITHDFDVKLDGFDTKKLSFESFRGVMKVRLVDSEGVGVKYVDDRPVWRPAEEPKVAVDSKMPARVIRPPIPRSIAARPRGRMGIGRGGSGGSSHSHSKACKTDDGWMHLPVIEGVNGGMCWSYNTKIDPTTGREFDPMWEEKKFRVDSELTFKTKTPPTNVDEDSIVNKEDPGLKIASKYVPLVGYTDNVPANMARIFYRSPSEIAGIMLANYGKEQIDRIDDWKNIANIVVQFNRGPDNVFWADIDPARHVSWHWSGYVGESDSKSAKFEAGSSTELKITFSDNYLMTTKLSGPTFDAWANAMGGLIQKPRGGRVHIVYSEGWRFSKTKWANTLPGKSAFDFSSMSGWPSSKKMWLNCCRIFDDYYAIEASDYLPFEYPDNIDDDFEVEIHEAGLWLRVVDNNGLSIPFVEGTVIPLAQEKHSIDIREFEMRTSKDGNRPTLFNSDVKTGDKMLALDSKSTMAEIDKLIGPIAAKGLDTKETKLAYAKQGAWYDPMSRCNSDAGGFIHMEGIAPDPIVGTKKNMFNQNQIEQNMKMFDKNKYYVLYLWSRSRDDLKPDRRIVFKGADLIDLGVIEMPGYVASEKSEPDEK